MSGQIALPEVATTKSLHQTGQDELRPEPNPFIVGPDDPILITGATGFIGPALMESLSRHGFRNLRAIVRPSSSLARLEAVASRYQEVSRIEVIKGNLLSRDDCAAATKDVKV